TLIKHYTSNLKNNINSIEITQEFANDCGLLLCNNYRNLEKINQKVREQQIQSLNKCNILFHKLSDNNDLICNECYKYQIMTKIENENPILSMNNNIQSFETYKSMNFPDDINILTTNLPYYKKIPNSIRMPLFELYNSILQMINLGDYKLDKKQLINGFKVWIMTNKVVLTKLNRGGSQTTKMMLNKIENIKRGKLLEEWKKLMVKAEIT